jgi:hypothetical protein
MTQRELEEEPTDVFEMNLSIMSLESKLEAERIRRIERQNRR